jgi:hypothetical protein
LFPVGAFSFSVALAACALVPGALTLPAWSWALPKGGAQLFPGVYVHTPWQLAVVAVIALVWAPAVA